MKYFYAIKVALLQATLWVFMVVEWVLGKLCDLVIYGAILIVLMLNIHMLDSTVMDILTPKTEEKKEVPLFDRMRLGAKVPPPEIYFMFQNMKKITGFQDSIGEIYIKADNNVNAYVTHNFNNVYITTGLLKKVKYKDEIAFVIGHELGHAMLGHTSNIGWHDNRRNEYIADLIGVYLMQKVGYNPCIVPGLWLRLRSEWGLDLFTTTHPSPLQRAVYLNFPSCGKDSNK